MRECNGEFFDSEHDLAEVQESHSENCIPEYAQEPNASEGDEIISEEEEIKSYLERETLALETRRNFRKRALKCVLGETRCISGEVIVFRLHC